ncbi:XkdQ/YqbQ family protein [Anoxybacillus gonensis]|uniref:XkdQ/YqbQ family protein n=1 Tax=Anoxybacillus gonensis TaxID=198467 RepID=UPI003D768D29
MEVLIDNRDGTIWEMPVSNVQWKTSRIGKAGTLDAKLVIEDPLKFPVNSGAIIRVTDGSYKIFYGYVFETGFNASSDFSVKAYDQLRYLMYNDTFVFSSTTATAGIKKIASDAGLKIGTFEETGYKVPAMVEDNKKALDVVAKFLDSTLIATNRNYVLFDNFGKLELRNINNMAIQADDFYIGEESLLFDFEYKKSIDEETYNRIKIVQDNKKTGKREVYIAQDSKNIAKWGRLQEFRKVDEKMSAAQIKDLLDKLIKLRNRETKSLKLNCLGHWKVRAGCFVFVYIEKIGIKQYFLVDECTHNWEGGVHTMQLDLKVI